MNSEQIIDEVNAAIDYGDVVSLMCARSIAALFISPATVALTAFATGHSHMPGLRAEIRAELDNDIYDAESRTILRALLAFVIYIEQED